MKKQIFILFTLCYFMNFSVDTISAYAPPMPAPPSQEKLDELKRLGDENLKTYGSAPDGIPPQVTNTVQAKPTPVPTRVITPTSIPSPTISLSPTKVSTQSSEVLDITSQEKETISFFTRIRNFFSNLFRI